MTNERAAALETLLADASAAHAAYEKNELNGVYDQEWARWYAEYAVEHGLDALLGRPITASELAEFLTRSWDEFQQRGDPDAKGGWAAYTAHRMATELTA